MKVEVCIWGLGSSLEGTGSLSGGCVWTIGMNPNNDDSDVLSPGFPWSRRLSGPPWTPRCGGEYEGFVGWGHLVGPARTPALPVSTPQGPPGQKGSKGSLVSTHCSLGLPHPSFPAPFTALEPSGPLHSFIYFFSQSGIQQVFLRHLPLYFIKSKMPSIVR